LQGLYNYTISKCHLQTSISSPFCFDSSVNPALRSNDRSTHFQRSDFSVHTTLVRYPRNLKLHTTNRGAKMPIAQTHIHDYRTDSSADSGYGHFGAPIGGVELKISGISDDGSVHGKVGSLEMSGPIVAAKGWVHTGVKAKWRRDGCLEVAF